MYDLRLVRHFQQYFIISGRWEADSERLVGNGILFSFGKFSAPSEERGRC